MSIVRNNLICRCYLTENYFIKQIRQHISFTGRQDFLNTHAKTLAQECTKEEVEDILNDLEREQWRRQGQGRESNEWKKIIESSYVPLHSHVYKLQEDFLSPELLMLAQLSRVTNSAPSDLHSHVKCMKGAERVNQLPVFTPQFCQDLKEEIIHFEKSDLPKGRPNTMNHYGVLLEEMLDMDDGLIRPLRERYLSPISKAFFPECVSGSLDSHKAFVVTYRIGQDLDLDYHYDNAEVTVNISLDDRFEGGDLYFGSMKAQSACETKSFARCVHKRGLGLLHRGQHLHGAMPLESGERQNLIVWMRSSEVRNSLCPMCGRQPVLIETEGSGDGFATKQMDVCTTA